jgi:HK97 family phage portal protein
VKRRPSILRRSKIERRYSPAAGMVAPGFTASMTVPSVAGVMVTPQTALTFSAFFAAVRVIAEDLACLPMAIFQTKGNSTRLATESPLNYLLCRSPDGECPAFNWFEAWIGHALSWGNAYAEILWTDEGIPETLQMINPAAILPKRDMRSGKLYYELTLAESVTGPQTKRIAAPWQILHFAGLGFNGLAGYSPVALAREMIGLGKSAEQFGAAFFGNGAVPNGIVKFARSMKPEALKNFRENWNLVHQGSAGAHKVALLEEGAEYQSIGIPPEDAQFLATRAFQVLEICRIFRLPPHKLADYSQSHLDNIEASNEDYVATCLGPWAIRLEQAINWRLLTNEEWADGYYCKHDFRRLLLRTAKDKADFYQKMFQIGYYTVDEMKALEGENPIGDEAGGAKRFVMSNLADITKAGDPAQAQQEKPAQKDAGRPERFSLNGANHG